MSHNPASPCFSKLLDRTPEAAFRGRIPFWWLLVHTCIFRTLTTELCDSGVGDGLGQITQSRKALNVSTCANTEVLVAAVRTKYLVGKSFHSLDLDSSLHILRSLLGLCHVLVFVCIEFSYTWIGKAKLMLWNMFSISSFLLVWCWILPSSGLLRGEGTLIPTFRDYLSAPSLRFQLTLLNGTCR